MDLERSDLILLLEKQENCDVTFVLKHHVKIKAHKYVLSILSARFYNVNRDSLVFIMDNRIEERAMWNFMRFMYARKPIEIDEQNKDSFIILAYFFDVQEMIAAVDQYMFKTLSVLTAIERFFQVILMNMSYNIKGRIFDYIKRNVIQLPSEVTLDTILLKPSILLIAQKAHNNYMEHISRSENDLPPVIEVDSDVLRIIIDNSPRNVITENKIKVTMQGYIASEENVTPADLGLTYSDVELIDSDEESVDSDVELIDSDEELIDSNEELIDSNEEMVDSNEEMVDSNEEMDDSNEEMDDSNEEMVDSNEEMVDSNEELIDSNEEMIDSNEELIDSNEELIDSDEESIDSDEESIDSDEELIDSDEELIDSDEELDIGGYLDEQFQSIENTVDELITDVKNDDWYESSIYEKFINPT